MKSFLNQFSQKSKDRSQLSIIEQTLLENKDVFSDDDDRLYKPEERESDLDEEDDANSEQAGFEDEQLEKRNKANGKDKLIVEQACESDGDESIKCEDE